MSENETKTELFSEREGELAPRRQKTVDFIAKLVCLLLAFFLWYYAKASDTAEREEVFSDIPVEIVNESGFSVLSGEGVTVDLTLSGKRSIIRHVSSSDIRAYVDMSHITEAGQYKLEIQFELPNGVTLEKSSFTTLRVYADNTASVTLPVKVYVKNHILEDGYELHETNITTDRKHIVVTGPEALIDTLSHASLTVDIGGYLNGSVTYKGEIVIVDQDGNTVTNSYLHPEQTTVTATIPVYRERVIPIEVRYEHGLFHEANCEMKISPSSVTVYGPVEAVNAISLSYVVNEKAVKGNRATLTYGITLPTTVQNRSEVSSVAVELTLKEIGTATYVVDVEVRGEDGMSYEPLSVMVTLRGEASVLASLTPAMFRAVADVRNLSDLSAVPLVFEFDESCQGKVYEFCENGEPYTVSVQALGRNRTS